MLDNNMLFHKRKEINLYQYYTELIKAKEEEIMDLKKGVLNELNN
jgi:hypothetical protein